MGKNVDLVIQRKGGPTSKTHIDTMLLNSVDYG